MTQKKKYIFVQLSSLKRFFVKNPISSLMSLFLIYLICKFSYLFFDWAILKASFTAKTAESCQKGGACWAFISERFYQILYGFYPKEDIYRVHLFLGLISYYAELPLTSILIWTKQLRIH